MWLVIATGVCILAAAVCWLYAVSGFSLSFVACNGAFSIGANLVQCRRPVVFFWLFWASIGLGVSLGVAALYFLVIRRREPKGPQTPRYEVL
jgi:hypothetical protein